MNKLAALFNLLINLLILPFLWLDCLANLLLGGSIKETLSSRAHRMRVKRHRYWGWTANAIDAVFFFQPDHCRNQYWREVEKGWHR